MVYANINDTTIKGPFEGVKYDCNLHFLVF